MEQHIIQSMAATLQIQQEQIQSTLRLLEEGNTVPFIARYRKEVTHGLDEEQIRVIQEQYDYQVNLEKRKEDVLRLIEQQGKLTEEIKTSICHCISHSLTSCIPAFDGEELLSLVILEFNLACIYDRNTLLHFRSARL